MKNHNWHSETIESMKSKSIESLLFIQKDAYEAAMIGETINNPKAGQYMDEFHYASMEIKKRQSK